MKILIIGGTQFFGKILVEKLLDAGHELALLTRGNKLPASFWSKITPIVCDRTHYPEFKKKLEKENFDVVIDNVVHSQADIQSIIEVFAARANPPQYIFCSTAAVYLKSKELTAELKEEDAILESQEGEDHRTNYANRKRAAEKYLIEHHGAMPYTIIRPTVIEGPGDPHKRTWFWIQRIKDGAPIVLSTNDRETRYRHVSPGDVAQAFFLAVGNKKAFNQIYNVAGGKILTIEDYIQSMAFALGKNAPDLCWVPQEILNKELPGYELPNFYQEQRLILSIDKIKADLGYIPQEFSTWISETVQGYSQETTPSFCYEHRVAEKKVAELFKSS